MNENELDILASKLANLLASDLKDSILSSLEKMQKAQRRLEKEYVSKRELLRWPGISRVVVQRWIDLGLLRGHDRSNGRTQYSVHELRELMKREQDLPSRVKIRNYGSR